MSKDEGPAERLVESISEFRIELIEWIDSQLSSLSESETWAASGVGAIAPGKGLSAQPEAHAVPASAADHRVASQAFMPSEISEPPAQVDPRHRLDAVARRLGERLKLSEESRKGTEQANRDDVAKDQRRPGR